MKPSPVHQNKGTKKGQIWIETDKRNYKKKRQKQTERYQKHWGYIKF